MLNPETMGPTTVSHDILHKAFADRRGYLIINVSSIRTSSTLSLHYPTTNNITYAVKELSPTHDQTSSFARQQFLRN